VRKIHCIQSRPSAHSQQGSSSGSRYHDVGQQPKLCWRRGVPI
jgi:hypothetical protein